MHQLQELSGKFDPKQAAETVGKRPALAVSPPGTPPHPDSDTADAADFPGSHDGAAAAVRNAAPAAAVAAASEAPHPKDTPAAASEPPSQVQPPAAPFAAAGASGRSSSSSTSGNADATGAGNFPAAAGAASSASAPRVRLDAGCRPTINAMHSVVQAQCGEAASAGQAVSGHCQHGVPKELLLCQQQTSACPSQIQVIHFGTACGPCEGDLLCGADLVESFATPGVWKRQYKGLKCEKFTVNLLHISGDAVVLRILWRALRRQACGKREYSG